MKELLEKRMSSNFRSILALLLLLSLNTVSSNAIAQTYVPDELQPWQDWVLKDREYRDCPFFFDHSVDEENSFVCSWPGKLQLTVDSSGAKFSQQWTVYGKEQWINLPGSVSHWPDRVTVNDRRVAVVARNNSPSIKLATGAWRVSGRFQWDERPAILSIAQRSALVELTVDGKSVERPELSQRGIYLGERKQDTRARNAIRTSVYRLVADDIPTRLTTRLQIDVSGSVREEVLGSVLPQGFVPLSINSPLPAKLEADGNLRLQVRPGRWVISLLARGDGVQDSIARPPAGVNLATDEIWSYQSNDQLRVTAVEGLPAADPVQVETPNEWRNYPAFTMAADAVFNVSERSRGVLSAANELELSRIMWLAFDGEGFVVEDDIVGTMRTDWRLDMQGPFRLLSATENGQNLLITAGSGEGQTGVEVRQTAIDVGAIGQAETRGTIPVTGWDTRFTSVNATVNLPPGHKLLMAPGVDNAAGSWVSQWQLLDFFLVLIITVAVWRLFGRTAGVIALVALILSFHELNAPAWLWLNILIAIALMRVAPAGRLKQIVSGYQTLSAIALVIALVPFVAAQLRVAIYPQLEPQISYATEADFFEQRSREGRKDLSRSSLVMMDGEAEATVDGIVATAAKSPSLRRFSRYAPNAIVQAGPGIPSWRWNAYRLSWSGPVNAEQTMRLVVMPRWLVSSLRIAAVAMLLLFAAVLAAEIFKRRWSLPGNLTLGASQTGGFTAVAVLAGLLAASPDAQAEYPDPGLLQDLQQRLLEAPDCVPRCAEIGSATVDIGASSISMSLTVDAFENIAIPLPGSSQGWRPNVISVDTGSAARVIRSSNNTLWLHVTPGRHTVTLRGSVPAVDSLEIPFPTPPRVIAVESDAWFIAGIKDRRLTSGSLQLTRLQSADEGEGAVRWESSRFPAFARIERVIELDIDWRVRTTVYRIAPAQGALTLDVPLLQGESIVSGDFVVTDERVLVSMNPQQASVSWTSNLPLQAPLELQAADVSSWHEVWHFAVGNTWNAEFSGIPESNMNFDATGVRVAVFHPRGGEQLTLDAKRPMAVEGSTMAFDSVALNVNEGSRSRDVELQLSYRSTRGSQHVIQLPADAELTSVTFDDRVQPLRADDGQLTIGILPGEHNIVISWRESVAAGFRSSSPQVDIGAPASNINISVSKSQDRWLLATSGPKLGPAVLYWSELVAMIIFALILGRIQLTPLKTQHWLLLGLGFSTFNWFVLMLVVIWLMLCGAREKSKLDLSWWKFNAVQVVIGLATIVTLSSVVSAIPAGLLGTPDMHVVGHRSYGAALNWFADGSASVLPTAAYFSVPIWIYKALILTWALWLSFALLRWLPWVWQCFSADGLWRRKNASGSGSASDGSTK
jgi:hypothetical protein